MSLITLLLGVGFLSSANSAESADPREALKARLLLLTNISAEFELHHSHNPSPEAMQFAERFNAQGRTSRMQVLSGEENITGKFVFLDGSSRYESRRGKLGTRINVYLDERVEGLIQGANSDVTRGLISNTKPLPEEEIIGYALGLRLHLNEHWLGSRSFEGVSTATAPDGLLRLEIRDASNENVTHIWTIDPSKSYALVRYQVLFRPKRPIEPGRDQPGASRLMLDIRNLSFTSVDGIDLPKTIHCSVFHHAADGTRRERRTSTLNVTKYIINDPMNTKESLLIVWPVGAIILDERTKTPIRVDSKARTLDNDVLNKAAEDWSNQQRGERVKKTGQEKRE